MAKTVTGSYMHAVFESAARKASVMWTSLQHSFTKGGLKLATTTPRLVEFV